MMTMTITTATSPSTTSSMKRIEGSSHRRRLHCVLKTQRTNNRRLVACSGESSRMHSVITASLMMMVMMMVMIGSCLLLVSVTTSSSSSSMMFVSGFTVMPSFHNGRRSCNVLQLATKKNSNEMFQQHAGESNSAYLKRLAQIASDPVAFERMVMSESSKQAEAAITTTSNGRDNNAASLVNGADSSTNGTDQTNANNNNKMKYQRAEDWDKEQAEKAAGKGISWDEKVQFDGLRMGNGFRQNEILRQNIHRNTY